MYHRWPRFIGDLEICPVQLPGRENRIAEPQVGSYEELAAAIVPQLRPHLDRPFAFFGPCGVASAAYEITRQLDRQGEPMPACLFVSSAKPPQDGPYGRFVGLSRAELTVEMGELISQLGGTPTSDLTELAAAVLAADVAAAVAYTVPEPSQLPCRVMAIGWDADPEVRPEQMAGWARCGDAEFAVLTGGHFAFLELGEELRDLLSARVG